MKLDAAIHKIFQQSTIQSVGNEWHLDLPKSMPRKHYESVKRVVNGLRGEWVRSKGTHVFLHDATAEIESIQITGFAPDYIDNPHAFFPTPHEEIADMMLIAGLRDWHGNRKFLEPHGGDGRIIRSIHYACPGASVDYCEIDERNLQLLEGLGNCVGQDFLTVDLKPVYDFIIMNPPFNGKEYQKHIRKAHSLLCEGGKLVAVMPSSAVSDRKFRDWMFADGQGSFYKGEYEFLNTKVSYITVEMDKNTRISDAPSGFKTWSMYHVVIALDSNFEFCNHRDGCTTMTALESLIESSIDRLVRTEGYAQSCTPETTAMVAEYFAEDTAIAPTER